MTCIVGLVRKGEVWMGADSAGVGGLSLERRSDRKVQIVAKTFVIGFTSSFRMGQLLTVGFQPPQPRVGEDLMHFMVNDFVDAVRNRLKAGGYAERDKEVERGGTFLVGYAGRLFKIEGDYQVGERIEGFNACGCGDDLALGSLYSTQGKDPRGRLMMALQAAEAFSAGVSGPFNVETLKAGATP